MSESGPNLAASLHQRLLHVARSTGQDFQQVLTRFAIERLLVRLVSSPHSNDFILKGAMLFAIWVDEPYRPTVDLDLLGRGSIDEERLRRVLTEVAQVDRQDDALVFDPATLSIRRIREGELYEGLQAILPATLGKARIRVKIDVGFGDAVTPAPTTERFPTLLQLSPLVVRAYPRETVIAEKLHAVVTLGMTNSRMKDFYDLWFLTHRFDFAGATVLAALRATFERRGTAYAVDPPIALTDAFTADAAKQAQWTAFVRKTRFRAPPPELPTVIADLGRFALPLLNSLRRGSAFQGTWRAAGPWVEGDG